MKESSEENGTNGTSALDGRDPVANGNRGSTSSSEPSPTNAEVTSASAAAAYANSPGVVSLGSCLSSSSIVGGLPLNHDFEKSPKVVSTKNDTRDKIFMCSICNRSFGYKHVLQNHERTHTGEKPFECKECHKRFTRDHHLKTHMRLHTGEKPYHCSHCERQFVQVANLRRHLRVHTGERPYACELCPSRFSDSNQLKAHMLIHKGEKPFECQKCYGKFRRRHHLMHHKCPKDEANIGKPRRGRRPKAYDQLPIVDSYKNKDSISLDVAVAVSASAAAAVVGSTSSLSLFSPPLRPPPTSPVIPMPPTMIIEKINRRKQKHTIRILTPQQRELFLRDRETMQTQAIDMSRSPNSEGTMTVIVPPQNIGRYISSSTEGALDLSRSDLSSSRSDSEAEAIEEEVEEEDMIDEDMVDEGMNSGSDDSKSILHNSLLQRVMVIDADGDDRYPRSCDSEVRRIHEQNGDPLLGSEDDTNGTLTMVKPYLKMT